MPNDKGRDFARARQSKASVHGCDDQTFSANNSATGSLAGAPAGAPRPAVVPSLNAFGLLALVLSMLAFAGFGLGRRSS